MPGTLFIADATRRQLGQLFGAEHASLRAAHRRQTRIVLMGLWIAEIHQDTVAHVTYGRFPRAMGRSRFDGGEPAARSVFPKTLIGKRSSSSPHYERGARLRPAFLARVVPIGHRRRWPAVSPCGPFLWRLGAPSGTLFLWARRQGILAAMATLTESHLVASGRNRWSDQVARVVRSKRFGCKPSTCPMKGGWIE